MIEKILEVSLLYDFYGQMLTEKQRQIIELYYNEDLSLGEISKAMNISRQGVHDMLKRSEKVLHNYEEKLRLVEKFMCHKSKIKEAYMLLDSICSDERVDKIKLILCDILETNI